MEKDGKKRRQIFVKEKKISRDEFMAASIGDCEWLDQSLRDGHNPCLFNRHGLAPIHLASLHGRVECLKLLVEKYNVDVNLPSTSAWSPLHLALNKESNERALACVEYLLENGADVTRVNKENLTVTHQAASEGLANCLLALLDNNAPIEKLDSRKQTPYSLARLWGHKDCARLLQLEEWKREKEAEDAEKKKLENLKNTYKELQQEALHQLQNEQEFYDSVTFGNWLADRGFSPNTTSASAYGNDRHSQHATRGLAQRLQRGSTFIDCATRIENLYGEKRFSFKSSRSNKDASTLKSVKKSKAARITSDSKRPAAGDNTPTRKHAEKKQWSSKAAGDKSTIKKQPKHEVTALEKRPEKATNEFRKLDDYKLRQEDVELLLSHPDWNFSTNVDSTPVTDIRHPRTISLSIKPSEDAVSILPTTVSLSVTLETDENNKFSLKVVRPGGVIEKANVDFPSLPAKVIRQALHGKEEERIRIPQEFQCVHIFDVQRKGRPELLNHSTEVPWHLKMYKDGCCIECDCTQ